MELMEKFEFLIVHKIQVVEANTTKNCYPSVYFIRVYK